MGNGWSLGGIVEGWGGKGRALGMEGEGRGETWGILRREGNGSESECVGKK